MAIALVACASDETVMPETDLTEVQSSAHYTFHMAPGDSVDIAWQETYIAWLSTTLDVDLTTPLEYFKYRNRSHLASLTGRETNGFAEPGTPRFHTIWPIDNHEGVHTVVILYFGHPPALLNEGVAVAHQTNPPRDDLVARWNGRDVHDRAREFLNQGTLPPLEALLESEAFFQHDANITYPASGSFVRHLLDTYGWASFKEVLGAILFS